MPVIAALVVLGAATSASAAATPAPRLTIHSFELPTVFSAAQNTVCEAQVAIGNPAACDLYQVTVTNSGSLPSLPAEGPITITDLLPSQMTVQSITSRLSSDNVHEDLLEPAEKNCEPNAVPLKCEFPKLQLKPGQMLELKIAVTVQPAAVSGESSVASVFEGGSGTPAATTSSSDLLGSLAPPFGPNAFISLAAGVDGAPDSQAGDHPYEFTTRFDMNSVYRLGPETQTRESISVGDLRDAVVDLPIGFLGGALATPKCTFAQLNTVTEKGTSGCPLDTRVGHIASEPRTTEVAVAGGIYNMVPEHGVAAEFAFADLLHNSHVIYASVVPTPAGYVLRATSREITEIHLSDVIVTFYGDPAEKDAELRQQEVEAELRNRGVEEPHVEREHASTPVSMFTNPSLCSGAPLQTTVHMDSWEHPGTFNPDGTPDLEGPGSSGWVPMTSTSPPLTGCNALRFEPEAFTVKPETSAADTPTGLSFDLKIPQSQAPETLATPPLRNASVTLPPGLTVDPSSASGLQACSLAQVGMSASGVPNAAPPACPDASKIGSVQVTSPLVGTTLQGSVYLAAQNENPFHSLLAGYIVIDDETTGTIVKIPGELKTNPETGQITGVFKDNPQIPFSDLKIHFFGGPRGDLATPEACGTYTTTSDFSPWSAPESGPDATPSDSFQINNGCVSGFTPAFHAGTLSNQAGGFSPFTLSFSRNDNEEAPAGLTVTLPTGLLGKIAGVAECSDAQIAAAAANSGAAENASPSCPSSSQLGTVQTASGPGPNPFVVGGKAYLTGPYKGAPYGVAVIVPALAGPFDLGTVVIRQALYINPNDSHVTDISDPFPTILKGIPLRIKRVSVTLDRPEFTFNPTSCESKTVNATVTSIGGASAAVSSRFQAAGCRELPFHPEFTASTSGKTSKVNGASFHVKIGFPTGGQANIHKVELTIPSVLPSRLTTLQKACPEAQFNANPAGCPSASLIATAVAHTPLLPDPLVGPVYFVSHGGAAFPDTEIILQGDNVELIVDGHTDIKGGVTYSRFQTVPDAPVTSFEFKASEGPYSIFAAFGNLCQTEIKAPTTITAQNGAVLNQNTHIEVEGCSNTLSLISKRVKGNKVTLKIAVPAGGKLKVSGKGLSSTSKTAGGRETLTVTVHEKKGGKLSTKVTVTFTPSKGHKQSKSAKLHFSR